MMQWDGEHVVRYEEIPCGDPRWRKAMGWIEESPHKVFTYHRTSGMWAHTGEYGWKALSEVPELLKMTVMLL